LSYIFCTGLGVALDVKEEETMRGGEAAALSTVFVFPGIRMTQSKATAAAMAPADIARIFRFLLRVRLFFKNVNLFFKRLRLLEK